MELFSTDELQMVGPMGPGMMIFSSVMTTIATKEDGIGTIKCSGLRTNGPLLKTVWRSTKECVFDRLRTNGPLLKTVITQIDPNFGI